MATKGFMLVVVESPTKAKTIGRILGKDYIVEASMGHLRDLPKASLGVDVDNNFQPQYVIPTKSRKTVTKLKKLIAEADGLILATDEDREGEAIGWHITQVLDIKAKDVKRIVFHEITDEAVKDAINHPREIDLNLVTAQQARRVLDRLVGYKLSPLLWKKIFRGLSAGRVQSVAVRLIVEREREREKFVSKEYWKIKVVYRVNQKEFAADLMEVNGKKVDISTKKDADQITAELKKDDAIISEIKNYQKSKKPSPPFTTSTLQQQAGIRLGFSVKKTMTIAQQLYEGISLGQGGQVGLITYMRTDSNNITPKVIDEIRNWVKLKFGNDFISPQPRFYKTITKRAQEAHEAIRSTSPERDPASIAEFLSTDQLKLYKLIWERAIASQMSDAIIDRDDIYVSSGDNKFLIASGINIRFKGFLVVMSKISLLEQSLPKLAVHDKLDVQQVESQQKFTEPLPRYTEPTLVKTLEKLGVGRPSTYAPTITTITTRGYVRKEQKQLVPQEVGFLVNDFLVEHFPEIVNAEFTAHMEDDLDKIAEGKEQYIEVLSNFYKPFADKLAQKEENVAKKNLDEETDEVCDKCGKPMVVKMGRFGKFLACSGFPECKNTKSLNVDRTPIMDCPKCANGEVVVKKTKRGKMFWGCNKYPKCDFASWNEPLPNKSPTCGRLMVILGRAKIPTCNESGFQDKEIKT